MRKLIVKILYMIYAFKRINIPHLGDVVIYGGIKCVINQGVASPYFDLSVLDGTNSRIRINNVHESQFKLAKPICGRIMRFIESYKFKMNYWFYIDVRESLFSGIRNVGLNKLLI